MIRERENLTGEQYVRQIGWPYRESNHDGVLYVICPWCKAHSGLKGDAYISKLSGKGQCRRANNCGRKWSFYEFREKTGDRNLPVTHFQQAARREYKKPEAYKPATEEQEARAKREMIKFFTDRGLDLGVVDSLGIRPAVYHGRPAICYPLKHSIGGEELNRRYRVWSDVEEKGWRKGWKNFRWEPGCQVGLLGRDTVEDTEGPLVIVEGQDDLVAVRQMGLGSSVSIPNAVRPPTDGKTELPADLHWLREEHSFLAGYKAVFLMLDNDEAGEYTSRTIASVLGNDRCFRVRFPEGIKDACDAVKAGWTKDDFRTALGLAEPYTPQKIRNLREFIEPAMQQRESPVAKGDPVCLPQLNAWMGGGARGGESTYIIADDGTGKTTLIMNIIVGFALRQIPCCVFSGEDNPIFITEWLGDMLLAPGEEFNREAVESRLHRIAPYVWFINHVGSIPVDSLIECYTYAARVLGVRQFFTDSLMMLQVGGRDYFSGQVDAVRSLTDFAKAHNVHHWILWHPRKGSTDETTGRDKASGGGRKEISSLHHNGFILYTEVNDEEDSVRTFIKHVKGRKYGRHAGIVELVFDKARRTYREQPVELKPKRQRRHISTWHEGRD